MRPIIYASNGNAFDATTDKVINFTWSGNQAFKNRLRVYNNYTNELVYDVTQDSFKLSHTIEANSLTNGSCYYCIVTVFDVNDVESMQSNALLFYCYSLPIITLNIENDQVIRNSYYNVNINYYQAEGEMLDAYKLYLYNGLRELIYSTDIVYDVTSMTIPLNNLEDNTDYYVQIEGSTVNGLEFLSSEYHFYVEYLNADVFMVCGLENVDGKIQVQSNVIAIEGKCTVEEKYIDGAIDVRTGYVYFDDNFQLSNDLSLLLTGYDFQVNQMICNIGNTAYVYFRQGAYESTNKQLKYYFELLAPTALFTYRIQSSFINDTSATIQIQKVSDLYNIRVVS